MTAEEHLKQDTGNIITQLLFQLAMLKAENDRLREENSKPSMNEVPR